MTDMTSDKTIVSNNIGPDSKPVDRLYGVPGNDSVYLVQADYSRYSGRIFRKQIILADVNGNNFKSHCFVTADGRWFDRAGLPMEAPSSTVDEEGEDGQNS